MKRILLIVFLISAISICGAQNADSLRNMLPGLKGIEKVDVLLEVATGTKPIIAIEEARKALHLSKKLDYKYGVAKANGLIGIYHYEKTEKDSAYYYLDLARSQFETLGESGSTNMHWYLGMLFSSWGDYERAIMNFLEELKIAEQSGNQTNRANAYYGISGVYFTNLNDSVTTRSYLNKALEIFKAAEDERGISKIYNSIGLLFNPELEIDSAYYYGYKALEFAERSKNMESIAVAKTNLALLLTDSLPERAIQMIEDVIEIDFQTQNRYGLAFDLEVLSASHFKLKKYALAESFIDSAISISEELQDNELLANHYFLKKKILLDQKKYPEAVAAWEKYETYYDAQTDIAKANIVSNLNMKYEVDKKDQEITNLSEKINLERSRTIALSILAGLTLIVLGLFINRARLKKIIHEKEKAVLQSSETQKTLALENMEQKQKLEEQANILLKRKVNEKEREMTTMAATIARKNEILSGIKYDLNDISKSDNSEFKKILGQLSQSIENNFNLERDWKEFQRHFEEVHPNFFKNLQGQNSNLKTNDLRLCAYIRMNMGNKEIARLHNIESSSVITSKYRLKKKLGLDKEADLSHFIQMI